MALIDRLMHFDPDDARNMSVHEFAAACFEVMEARRTVAQVKAYYAMDAADGVEFDALIAKVSGTDLAKFKTVFSFEQVLILAEGHVTGYSTPTEVRQRLGI